MRDLIFGEMTSEWKAAYEAGIFTEFMEQRSPGHTVLDDKIYRKGMLDFKQDIERSLAALDICNDPEALCQTGGTQGHVICADALIRFAERHAEKARELARKEADPRAQGGTGAHCRGLLPCAGPRPSRFLGGPAGLLVCPPGRDHRAEPLGRLLPRPSGPAPPSILRQRHGGRHAHPRAGRGTAAMLLDQIQQPAGPAQGRRHGSRKQHLHRFCPDQYRRALGGRLGCRQRGHLSDPGRDRRDAAAAAQLLDPGQQKEPRSFYQASGQDHPYRLWPAVGVQLRPDRPGTGSHGQIGCRCPERRFQRLRRSWRLWQREL